MLLTAELRWFVSSRPGPSILGWFGADVPVEPPRIDRYLDLAGSEGVGVKLREGLLEIKARRKEPRELLLAEGYAGRLECWAKVGNPAPTDAWLDARWVDVRKERRLRRLTLEGAERPPSSAAGSAGEGCHFELTELTFGGRSAWTLGLEAYGTESRLEDAVVHIARDLLAEAPADLELRSDSSCGYPAWLARSSTREAPCP
jgi:hypothetical protein